MPAWLSAARSLSVMKVVRSGAVAVLAGGVLASAPGVADAVGVVPSVSVSTRAVEPVVVSPVSVRTPVDVSVAPVVPPVALSARVISAASRAAARRAAESRSAAAFGRSVIAEARKHYGAPYRWGATGPSRFDCSGFTGHVFRHVGVRLPRTSREQYAAVRHVSRSSIRIGDLVFEYSSSGRIHHVGIFAGNHTMWAATHTGDIVRTERMPTSRYWVGRVR